MLRPLVALLLCAPAVDPLVQHDPSPRVRGSVVRDEDRLPIEGAILEPKGVGVAEGAATDAQGTFDLLWKARCGEPSARDETGIDYIRISAAGRGLAFLDPCADAPWTSPVHLRPGAELSGKAIGLSPGLREVTVSAAASELVWPPRSGLTCSDEVWRVTTDAAGRFEIEGLPAQVELTVVLDKGSGIDRELQVVLAPGERREIELVRGFGEGRADDSVQEWRFATIAPTATSASGPRPLTEFDLVGAGRHRRHPHLAIRSHDRKPFFDNRWAFHGHRACHHLEAQPGRYTLVGRDASGWIGCSGIDVGRADKSIPATVNLAPGALLRLDGSGLAARTELTLSSSGATFAEVDLLPGVVRYEVVPAGMVKVNTAVEGQERQTREITATAGEVLDLKL